MSKFNMQNVIVWIRNDVGGFRFRYKNDPEIIFNYLRLQVENSLELGWDKEDIILITNFPFEYMGVKAYVTTNICEWSSFVNKLVVVNEMIKKGVIKDNFWLHDADAYQLEVFNFPEECKDVGFTKHAPGREKPQGGSSFYRKGAYDIIDVIATMIGLFKPKKEESFFPVFYQKVGGLKVVEKYRKKVDVVKLKLEAVEKKKDGKEIEYYKKMLNGVKRQYDGAKNHFGCYADRFSWLNWTYCLFRQGQFATKYPKSIKPIKVVHFHTEYPSTMNCFYYGKNAYNVVIVTDRLKRLFVKHNLVKTN